MATHADRLTVAAIAVVIYAAGAVIHEGIGHGGACLATGGRMAGMSAVHFECAGGAAIAVAAAGTIANLVAGLLLYAALGRAPSSRPHLRYALWLGMAVNLMQAAGYFLFSGALGIGDWAEILRALGGGGAARAAMAVAGAGAYFGVVCFAARAIAPLLPADPAAARQAARSLTLTPWIAGGVVSCLAGALNPVGFLLVAISAAAASFGGTSGLVWMPDIVGTRWAPGSAIGEPAVLGRHRVWVAAGVVAALVLIVVLGPGLPRR
jgi:hypothetical protein